jgi:hypothetical protein
MASRNIGLKIGEFVYVMHPLLDKEGEVKPSKQLLVLLVITCRSLEVWVVLAGTHVALSLSY